MTFVLQPLECPSTVEVDNACDDEVDYSEENALYCEIQIEIPNRFSVVEYHQMFCYKGESDFEF